MKIKIFKYDVSNPAAYNHSGLETEYWFKSYMEELIKPEEIEKEINEFCLNKTIIDIRVNSVDVNYNNTSGGNTIQLWYTIIYEE